MTGSRRHTHTPTQSSILYPANPANVEVGEFLNTHSTSSSYLRYGILQSAL